MGPSSHLAAGQSLRDLADFYSLVCSLPALSVPIYYSDISGHANSVIDLIFLGMSCAQVTHHIEPNLRRPSDYAPENICVCRIVLKCDSEEETVFLLSVSEGLSQLNVYHCGTGPDTSRSQSLSLYSSQTSLLMIPPRPLGLLFYLTHLASSLRR